MMFNRIALLFMATALPAVFASLAAVNYPSIINAGSYFQISVSGGDSTVYTPYRVYLATTPSGYAGGPSCYLNNMTSIATQTITVMIPLDLGPNANDYSILVREFSSNGTPGKWTNGTQFTLTGSTIGDYSQYEKHLDGAALWPADNLPCSSYSCARACATASYPDDLNYSSDAYKTMSACVDKCSGVTDKTAAQISSQNAVATASKTATASSTASSTSSSKAAANAAPALRWQAPSIFVAAGAIAAAAAALVI